MACSLFRRRKHDECIKMCTQMLEKNPYDQVFIREKEQIQISLKLDKFPYFDYFNFIFFFFVGCLDFKNESAH
jgi:hypothetical protein